jgi:hypothetical protein
MTNYKSRLPAAATCVANGWKVGDKLVSKEWRMVKRLVGTVSKTDINIHLISIRPDGRSYKEEFLKTLPLDVRLLDAGIQSNVGN